MGPFPPFSVLWLPHRCQVLRCLQFFPKGAWVQLSVTQGAGRRCSEEPSILTKSYLIVPLARGP